LSYSWYVLSSIQLRAKARLIASDKTDDTVTTLSVAMVQSMSRSSTKSHVVSSIYSLVRC